MNQILAIVLAVLSLLNVIFIPAFDVWGGLFPSSPEINFFDVLQILFTDSDALQYWAVLFVLTFLIPSVLMMIAALIGKKGFFVGSAVFGVVSWVSLIMMYVSQYGMDELLDFDDGSVAVGTWIAILLFVLSLILIIPSRPASAPFRPTTTSNSTISPTPGSQTHMAQRGTYCPKCGRKIEGQTPFCGYCGHEF